MKVVIIGGVAGGASAAARLRRLDEKAQIVMFERSGYISYANCGLPYYLGGVIVKKQALSVQTVAGFSKRFNVDVRIKSEVKKIDRAKKIVEYIDESGEQKTESYDKLLISPGAKPIKPPMPGIDEEGIFCVKNVEDTLAIKDYMDNKKPQSAVVVGGGFIGLEAAENLKEAGLDVTIVERNSHLHIPFDDDMATFLHAGFKKAGINVRLKQSVAGFERRGEKIITKLETGEEIAAEIVILAIGVAPESAIAKEAGLKLGIRDSIVVDEHMMTSDPDIYAAGDVVEVTHRVTSEKTLLALAGPANKQGRIAADSICGVKSSFKGSQGSAVIKYFGMTAASTGINEAQAKALKLSYDKVILTPFSHASYYPGATPLTLKLIYETPSGRILGAQLIGEKGVDKRCDTIAVTIAFGGTVSDLTALDLCYAPPYSSAKDPVNMAGFAAENTLTGLSKQADFAELSSIGENGNFIDVRTPGEYANGNIPNFKNIPLDEIRERMEEIDKSKPVYLHCHSGLRSYLAARILMQEGFDAYNLRGGYLFYKSMKDDGLI